MRAGPFTSSDEYVTIASMPTSLSNDYTDHSTRRFWLLCTYLRLYFPLTSSNSSRHGEAYRHFSAIIGWKALKDSVDHFGNDHEFTKLITDLKGRDPDDAFSSIPYEKGFNFLFHIENLVGKPKFDKFIPHVRPLCTPPPSQYLNA